MEEVFCIKTEDEMEMEETITFSEIKVEEFSYPDSSMKSNLDKLSLSNGFPEDVADLPWPSYRQFFKCVEVNGKNLKARCKLCLPNLKNFSCSVNACSNLRKHLSKAHPTYLPMLDSRAEAARKRKFTSLEESSNQIKQIKTQEDVKEPKLAQDLIDNLVTNFVIDTFQPFSICDGSTKEGAAFEKLVHGLRMLPIGGTVVDAEMLQARLELLWHDTKNAIIELMSEVSAVSLTVDYWMVSKRIFIGVTAHWINPTTLNRECAVLACRMQEAFPTLDQIKSSASEICDEYKIQNKISGITTDNASNFVENFRITGIESVNFGVSEDGLTDEITFIEVTELTRAVPQYYRCVSHTLNLVGANDSEKAKAVLIYEQLYTQMFSKCIALWKKQRYSPDDVDIYFKLPTGVLWNSYFDALNHIKQIIKSEEGVKMLNSVCDRLNLDKFEDNELLFLKEYVEVMTPLTSSLNILQSKNNMYQGYLLPTLYQLMTYLKEMKDKNFQFCIPLVCSIIDGISLRFKSVWWKREFVIASCVHPTFKINWITEANKKKEAVKWILEELEYLKESVEDEVYCEDSADTNFFSFLMVDSTSTEYFNKSVLYKFLATRDRNLSILNSHEKIKQLFIKFNTGLPSSATLENIFGSFVDSFKIKWFSFIDEYFETKVLLNLNSKFRVI